MGLNNTDLPQTLIIDLSVRYGGSCSRVLSLLERLPRGSAALAVLENAEITKRARSLNLPFFTVGLKKSDPLILSRLIQIIRDYGFCVLDTQNIQSKFWGTLAAARTGTALISTLNSWHSEEHGSRLKGRIYQIIETATSRKLDLYIAVSQQIQQRLLKMGVRREMIAKVSNAIEIKKPPVSCNKRWLSNKFGFPNKSIVFCAVGRLEWVKGYEDLISAFSRISASAPYLCGLIMGEGSLYKYLSRLIARRGLQNRIKLTGFCQQEEVISVLNASDLFVMPSRFEGTPVALLEAAALGCPILATRVGGIPDLVKDGKQALLTPPGNIEALAANLLKLSQNSNLARQLGAGAQQRIKQDFSLKAQVEATQKAYKTALRHARRRIRDNENFTDNKHITRQK